MIDASPEARWFPEISEAAGYVVIVVSASFGGQGQCSHIRPNRGGGLLCRWWGCNLSVVAHSVGGNGQGKKRKLVQILSKCNEYR